MSKFLTKTLFGAAVGAAQASGLVPGAAFKLVADAVAKLRQQPKAVEFIARAMQLKEEAEFAQHGVLAVRWQDLREHERGVWRRRADNALHAVQQLSEHAARAALDVLKDPERLGAFLAELLAKHDGPQGKPSARK